MDSLLELDFQDWVDIAEPISVIVAALTGFVTLIIVIINNNAASRRYKASMEPFLSLETTLDWRIKSDSVPVRLKNTGRTAARNIVISSLEVIDKDGFDKTTQKSFKQASIVKFRKFEEDKKISYLAPGASMDFAFLMHNTIKYLVDKGVDSVKFKLSYNSDFSKSKVEEYIDIGISSVQSHPPRPRN